MSKYRPNVLIALRTIVGFNTVDQSCGEVPKVVKSLEILKAAMEPVSKETSPFSNPSVEESKVYLEGTLISNPTLKPTGLFDGGQHDVWLEIYKGAWQKHSASIETQGTSSVSNSAIYLGQPIRANAKILSDPVFYGAWYDLFLSITNNG
jgi:hypothetical protein